MNENELMSEVNKRATKYVDDNINNPTEMDYIYAINLILIGGLLIREYDAFALMQELRG